MLKVNITELLLGRAPFFSLPLSNALLSLWRKIVQSNSMVAIYTLHVEKKIMLDFRNLNFEIKITEHSVMPSIH